MAQKLRIIPLGGLGEIGKNMTVYEYGRNMIVVDCGVMFPENDLYGIDLVLPDYQYVIENKDILRGIVLTHGHMDHIAALPYLLREINAPIYGTPLTLSALTFNILMGFAGGGIAAWIATRDPFWMMSGALGGIISVAAGLDLYWPPMAFAIAFAGGILMPIASRMVERMGIDDAVGAVALHGVLGVWGVIAVGIFASGYPALNVEGAPTISLMGQIVGAVVVVVLGLVAGYVVSLIVKMLGLLRVPREAEVMGLDRAKVPAVAYPEILGGAHSPSGTSQ